MSVLCIPNILSCVIFSWSFFPSKIYIGQGIGIIILSFSVRFFFLFFSITHSHSSMNSYVWVDIPRHYISTAVYNRYKSNPSALKPRSHDFYCQRRRTMDDVRLAYFIWFQTIRVSIDSFIFNYGHV